MHRYRFLDAQQKSSRLYDDDVRVAQFCEVSATDPAPHAPHTEVNRIAEPHACHKTPKLFVE